MFFFNIFSRVCIPVNCGNYFERRIIYIIKHPSVLASEGEDLALNGLKWNEVILIVISKLFYNYPFKVLLSCDSIFYFKFLPIFPSNKIKIISPFPVALSRLMFIRWFHLISLFNTAKRHIFMRCFLDSHSQRKITTEWIISVRNSSQWRFELKDGARIVCSMKEERRIYFI